MTQGSKKPDDEPLFETLSPAGATPNEDRDDISADFFPGEIQRTLVQSGVEGTVHADASEQISHEATLNAEATTERSLEGTLNTEATTDSASDGFEVDEEKPEELEQPIPGFRVETELGRGAFGVVYRAVDVKLDRQVAIKIPLLTDPRLTEKYIQEARNAARIETAGIVPVYQVGTTHNNQPFVVQKLIDGTTLRDLIRGSENISAGHAVEYMFKVATAIAGAHQAGLVHRDLKPANILIDRSNEPWVADFGLAVFEDDQQPRRGEIAGTPMYMSPEQLEGRADWLDGRADIWSLGVILYELISGKVPFRGTSFNELKEQILNRHPRPLSQRIAGVPPELDEIFRKCCAKNVNERYANAFDLAADLENVLLQSNMTFGDVPSMVNQGGLLRNRRLGTSTVHGRSVFERSTLGQSLIDRPVNWLPVGFASVGVISLLVGAYFFFPWSSFRPQPVMPLAPPVAEQDRPPVSVTELLVSQSGEGTHETLAAAIEAAKAGDEIRIDPGRYTESLNIAKDLKLVGSGSRSDVSLIGNGKPALTVADDCQLTLVNMTIESRGKELNTIELEKGSLNLQGCLLSTSGYDCVRAAPGTSLIARECTFQSKEHPAIVAKQTSQFSVTKCTFDFQLRNIGLERDQPIVAIELTEAGGIIRNCKFSSVDKVGKGISAKDVKSTLRVEGCTFSDLLHGLEAFGCDSLEMRGANVFSACNVGVVLENSRGTLTNALIRGCEYGLLLTESDFELEGTTIEKNARIGMWLVDSSCAIRSCIVKGHENLIAMLIDTIGDTDSEADVDIVDLELTDNQIGILLVAGDLRLEGGLISQNKAAGIIVRDHAQLPEAFRSRSSSEGAERSIFASRVTINGGSNAPAIQFQTTGRYELPNCLIVDVANDNRPALVEGLTTRGSGPSFEVVLRDDLPVSVD